MPFFEAPSKSGCRDSFLVLVAVVGLVVFATSVIYTAIVLTQGAG